MNPCVLATVSLLAADVSFWWQGVVVSWKISSELQFDAEAAASLSECGRCKLPAVDVASYCLTASSVQATFTSALSSVATVARCAAGSSAARAAALR